MERRVRMNICHIRLKKQVLIFSVFVGLFVSLYPVYAQNSVYDQNYRFKGHTDTKDKGYDQNNRYIGKKSKDGRFMMPIIFIKVE